MFLIESDTKGDLNSTIVVLFYTILEMLTVAVCAKKAKLKRVI